MVSCKKTARSYFVVRMVPCKTICSRNLNKCYRATFEAGYPVIKEIGALA